MIGRRASRPAVLGAIPLDRHAVIEASAGTGKTFVLEHLVIELLLSTDVPLEKLLIVTFTEKATNELRTRIRAKLVELVDIADGRREGRSADRVRAEERTSPATWTLDAVARAKLVRALRGFDGASITTIHAFCQRVLRDSAFASGRLFDERPVDGREAFGRAFREALRREVATDPERARWLQAALESGFAVPSIESLLWSFVQARAPLRPAFDPGALAAALAVFPVDAARRPDLVADMKSWGTHPSRALSVGRKLADLASLVERARAAGDLTRYVAEADGASVADLLEPLGAMAPPRDGSGATVCKAAAALCAATPPFAAALAHTFAGPLERAMKRTKRERGRYDFDDMLALVDQALHGPCALSLAGEIRRRWRYALIDEFQDTDETQWSIFRRLFFEGGDAPLEGGLFLVGDPKQSIYRFRGADVHTYLRARDEVVAGGGARVTLDDNYRATPGLVDAINAMFDACAAEPLVSGTVEYSPVGSGRPDRALLDAAGASLSPVHVLRFRGEPSCLELGRVIAREIAAATDPRRAWRFDGRPLEMQDCFVLTRNAREGRQIGAALREAGIPFAFFKEEGLFQSAEARDLRTLLAAIADPDDRARRLAAWLTPFFGLPLVAIERTRDLSDGHPLVARLRAWKALADARRFDRLFERIISESGIVRRAIFFTEGERELTNTMHLVEVLLERAVEGHTTLADLGAELGGLIAKTRLPPELEGNVHRLDSERRSVQIMTIHKSKGLEAPVVFVAGGFSQGLIDSVRVYHEGARRVAWVGRLTPAVKPLVAREEAEEDQRLAYVALTRAMGRLILPCVVDDTGRAKRLRGPYARVNRRIAELLDAGAPIVTVSDEAPPSPPGRTSPDRAGIDWTPPPALCRADDESGRYDALRARHAGVWMTSYTRMMSTRTASTGAGMRAAPAGVGEADAAGEKAGESSRELTSARGTGVFLHELLERVPLASFGSSGFELWRAQREIRELVDEAMTAHRIHPDHREHAERLVWAGFTTPVPLPTSGALDRLASCARVVREMRFVYPLDSGPDHGSSGRPGPAYVRGALDVAFEHDGLTYFLDWKSDALRSYAPDALAKRVAEHYAEQVQLYTLAVTKLIGIAGRDDHEARFGGILYCFLRGLDGRGGGVWSVRPTWDAVASWGARIGAKVAV